MFVSTCDCKRLDKSQAFPKVQFIYSMIAIKKQANELRKWGRSKCLRRLLGLSLSLSIAVIVGQRNVINRAKFENPNMVPPEWVAIVIHRSALINPNNTDGDLAKLAPGCKWWSKKFPNIVSWHNNNSHLFVNFLSPPKLNYVPAWTLHSLVCRAINILFSKCILIWNLYEFSKPNPIKYFSSKLYGHMAMTKCVYNIRWHCVCVRFSFHGWQILQMLLSNRQRNYM